MLCKLLNLKQEDLEEVEEWLDDCEITDTEIVDFIKDQIEELDCFIWDINFKALVLEYILTKADVTELIDYIDVFESDFKIDASKKQIDDALTNVLVEDRNDCWLFLAEYFGVETDIEDQKN